MSEREKRREERQRKLDELKRLREERKSKKTKENTNIIAEEEEIIQETATVEVTHVEVKQPEAIQEIKIEKKLIAEHGLFKIDIGIEKVESYDKGFQVDLDNYVIDADEYEEFLKYKEFKKNEELKNKQEEKETVIEKIENLHVTVEKKYELINDKESILNDAEYSSFMIQAKRVMERLSTSNINKELSIDYANVNKNELEAKESKLKLNQTLAHQKDKPISSIDFSSLFPELFLISYTNIDDKENTNADDFFKITESDNNISMDGIILVWNLNNSITPEYILVCDNKVLISKFHPFLSNVVIGATYSGQIIMWKLTNDEFYIQPIQQSLLGNGHNHPVYSMDFIGTSNSNVVVTVSTDGMFCKWDLKNLSAPMDTIELVKLKSSNDEIDNDQLTNIVGISGMYFPLNELNLVFFGTEAGALYQIELSNKKIKSKNLLAHNGPITAIKHVPKHSNNLFATTSMDWTCKIWNKKNIETCLYKFLGAKDYVIDLDFYSHKIFCNVDTSGRLYLWEDFEHNNQLPTETLQVSDVALTAIKISGNNLILGDSVGNIFIYDVYTPSS